MKGKRGWFGDYEAHAAAGRKGGKKRGQNIREGKTNAKRT